MLLKFLYVLLFLSMLAVVMTLIMGGRAMTSRKEEDRAASNKWMWRRIWAQGTALLLLGVTILVKRNGG